jgi:hypothetical protein
MLGQPALLEGSIWGSCLGDGGKSSLNVDYYDVNPSPTRGANNFLLFDKLGSLSKQRRRAAHFWHSLAQWESSSFVRRHGGASQCQRSANVPDSFTPRSA